MKDVLGMIALRRRYLMPIELLEALEGLSSGIGPRALLVCDQRARPAGCLEADQVVASCDNHSDLA